MATEKTYLLSDTGTGAGPVKEPELQQILDSLRDVTERLEARGRELWAFEPKVCQNGSTPSPTASPDQPPVGSNYGTDLRNLLGRLRAVEEGEGAALEVLRSFL